MRKFTRLFCLCWVVITCVSLDNLCAQVEVQTTNEVKLGDNITITPDVSYISGFEAIYDYNTTSIRKIYKLKSSGTTGHRTGILTNQSGVSGVTNGIENIVNTQSETKFGVNNQLNILADAEYGVSNRLNSNMNTDPFFQKTGVLNTVNANDAYRSWGVNNDINAGMNSALTYGIQNHIHMESDTPGLNYGTFNYMQFGSVTSGDIMGVRSVLNGAGTPDKAYAIYGETVGVPGAMAGFFEGDVTITGTCTQGSDISLKEDIKDLKSSMKELKKLKPKSYKLKKEKEDKERKTRYGFIAQDVDEVFPQLVRRVKQAGGYKEVITREEQRIIQEDGEELIIPARKHIEESQNDRTILTLDYIGIIPIAVAAIQEQQVEIDDLKKNNTKSFQDNTGRISQLEEELLITREALATTNKKYDQLVHHIETLLKCVDCDGLRRSGERGQIQFEDKFRLYPNPAKGSITIESLQKTSQSYQIAITDNAGRKVLDNYNLTDGLTPVDVSSLSSGLYNVSIIENGEVVATESLMIVNR